jgi:guanine deaminase
MTTFRARLLTPISASTAHYEADGILVVEDGRITQVAPYDGQPVDEDLRPGLLTPGFVDAHVHFPQSRIIGRASGPLLEWLDQSVFPEESRFGDLAYAERTAEYFADRLAASGTTLSFVYGSSHHGATDRLFSVLAARGARAIAGPVWMDEACPEALRVPTDEAVDGLEALVDRWHGHDDGRLQVAVIPRFALSCTPKLMRAAATVAERYKLRVSTHLAESVAECQAVQKRFGGASYVQVYEDLGLLRPGTVLAHAIHLSSDEWDRLARAKAVVAHCPDSNAFLGSGGMPLWPIRDRGIALSVGTDVAAGRSFRVPHTLSFAHDNARRQGAEISPQELFWWGTRGGAEALGVDSVGLLAPGLDADMALHDLPEEADTLESVLGTLLFRLDGPEVLRTWVRGRQIR